jgi:alanine-synthesizing transaminase
LKVAQRTDTHRYSASRGIPRLRRAITNWYKERYDVSLDPDTEAIVTLGSKEGLANLAQAIVTKGDTILVPSPAYPIHPYGFVIAGADIRSVPSGLIMTFSQNWRAPSKTLGQNQKLLF